MTLQCDADDLVLDVLQEGVQNPALVLKDEDGNSVTDLAEFNNSTELSLDTTVNIENSNDIIVGSVTQLNGPISIYASGPLKIEEEEEDETRERKRQKGNPVKNSTLERSHTVLKFLKNLSVTKRLLYIGIPLIIFVIVLIATITLLVFNSSDKENERPDDDDHSHDGDDILKPPDPGVIIEKDIWGGREPVNATVPLHHPVPVVIISHTASQFCDTFTLCKLYVQSIQDHHIAVLNAIDIGYNFVIGGDGNAYVGRGWDVTNFHRNETIGISFIGNFTTDLLTVDMINVTQKLLQQGLDKGKLSTDYILVPHNHTTHTDSPGPHVYEVIKTWPNFYPFNCTIDICATNQEK